MKKSISLFFLFFLKLTFAQENKIAEKYTAHNKGKFYFFYGGNRDHFSKSNITFEGENYNFTLENAVAEDKPKGWHLDYINPAKMTIPQTNFKLGYFINDHYNISIGLDHMKYVVSQNQIAKVTGYVNLPSNETGSIFNGIYTNTPVNLAINFDENDSGLQPPFLTYENTDGLNYIYTEVSRVDDFSKIFTIRNTDKIQINLTEGIGGGVVYPKTNAKILGYQRHDEFHVSGFGISAKVGLNITFFKYFFIQTELKGGYIDLDYLQTTNSKNDSAHQNFYFLQKIIAFGGIFRL